MSVLPPKADNKANWKPLSQKRYPEEPAVEAASDFRREVKCLSIKTIKCPELLYCPRCEIKPGNPLRRSVELSQILICLMHSPSFWRGGAQPYAYLVGPTVGDYFSVRQLCRCRAGERRGLWTKAKPLACNPAGGFAVSDLPYSGRQLGFATDENGLTVDVVSPLMSAIHPKADIPERRLDVRLVQERTSSAVEIAPTATFLIVGRFISRIVAIGSR